MSAFSDKARLWREKMLKAGVPLTKVALCANVKHHTVLNDVNLDEAIDADINREVGRVMRDGDRLGRLFYPCEWDARKAIARWDHRDNIPLQGWERNLDERLDQEITDRSAKRRIALVIEVLRQAEQDAGRQFTFAECEPEIVRRWQKAKVMP